MEVKQIYELVNDSTKEKLGESAVLQEDLSNVVEFGDTVENVIGIDNYVRSLVDHIGKVIFVNRPYAGSVPSVLMDKWEFGSVLEKISAELPEATENESWELQDGQIYSQEQFYKPVVTAKFYNSKNTFEIPISITERQVKESFSNATQLNAFISMIYNEVDKAMTIRIDGLVMSTINSAIAEVLTNGTAGVTKVNLLSLYNADHSGATIASAAAAITNPDFLRYASLKMKLTADRLTKISRLFNIGGKARFTPKDYLHCVMLSEFKEGAATYLYDANGQFNTESIKLLDAETVPYWQGSGTDYGFSSTSKIDVKLPSGTEVSQTGILAVMFDRDAIGVCNEDRRVTTAYNAKGEFYNNWYKFDCSYFVDTNENIVVFYVA